MSSSKVILIGAVSVIFGLYTMSLTRVESFASNTAEVALYITKAENNARSGAQRAIDIWCRQSGQYYESFSLTDPKGNSEGSFTYAVNRTTLSTWPTYYYQLDVTSVGTFKGPGEPASFAGHQVTRYVSATYYATGGLYNVKQKSAYSVVNYSRERQLDSLATLKGN